MSYFVALWTIDFVQTGSEFYSWVWRCATNRMRFDD